MPALTGPVEWPAGPLTEQVAELVRTLELTINRRLDGALHGNHQGLTPGHGSEPGESRPYQPGDDVRRIDWNVTARTTETHVREQIADRDLEAWVVLDTSAAMRFGTTVADKSQAALVAAAAVGFLTARNQNRLGAVLVAGPHLKVMPPRHGRAQVRAILANASTPPPSEGLGPSDLATAIDRVAVISKRRGFVAVVSDFGGTSWVDSLARLGMRHDLLAIAVHDPRELDVPPVGLIDVVDPSTGRHREVRVTAAVQRRYAAAAAEAVEARRFAIRRAGADLIELATDGDWLAEIVGHVTRRRTQAVNAQVIEARVTFAATFLAAGRLWWMLAVVALAAGYVATQLWGRRATVRFTQVDLLDRVAPSRPGWRRHVIAVLMLGGLASGVVAIARPVSATSERTESEGRILLLFDVSLSMMATDVEPTRLDAAKEATREFVDQVADDVEVGLISFSGNVAIEVQPTLDRDRLDQGIEGLELAESTAIGDALSTGANLLVRMAGDDRPEDIAPGAMVLLTDGETTVGRDTQVGAQEAADAGVPVFTIAFGTAGGTITDPVSGDVLPVPVQPAPLEQVAEVTGGASYEAATATELDDAYERIQESLGDTLGEEIDMVSELTWRWAALALVLVAAAWALAMWWLRGMV